MQKKMSVFMRRSTLLRLYRGPLLFIMAFVSWPRREDETISALACLPCGPPALVIGVSSRREASFSQLARGGCWVQLEEPCMTVLSSLWSIPCVPDTEGQ